MDRGILGARRQTALEAINARLQALAGQHDLTFPDLKTIRDSRADHQELYRLEAIADALAVLCEAQPTPADEQIAVHRRVLLHQFLSEKTKPELALIAESVQCPAFSPDLKKDEMVAVLREFLNG